MSNAGSSRELYVNSNQINGSFDAWGRHGANNANCCALQTVRTLTTRVTTASQLTEQRAAKTTSTAGRQKNHQINEVNVFI